MVDEVSLLKKYGVSNPGQLSSVVDRYVWRKFLQRRQDILDVTLPFAVMAPIVIPLLSVLILAFSLRGDNEFVWVLVGLGGATLLTTVVFLHFRSEEDAIAIVEEAERIRLEVLIESELGFTRGSELAVFGALSSFSWVTDGALYSVDYDEASNQYSFSVRRDPSQHKLAYSWTGARRLLQLM